MQAPTEQEFDAHWLLPLHISPLAPRHFIPEHIPLMHFVVTVHGLPTVFLQTPLPSHRAPAIAVSHVSGTPPPAGTNIGSSW